MKKYIYIFIVALAFVSCNDFLDQNPDNRADLSSPDDIKRLLVSAYPQYSHVWFAEVMSDNSIDVGPTAYADANLKESYTWDRVNSSNQDSPDGYWYSCYTSIAAANHALEAIYKLKKEGKYTAAELEPFEGEALLCRAYSHFMLVNLFSEHYDPATAESTRGIPYVTSVETQVNVKYDFLSVKAVYDSIEADIEKGFPLIVDTKYDQPKWHFNKKAAATFISRFYLYRGLDTDWDKVISYANIATEGKPASFLRDWLTTYNMSVDAFGQNYSKSDIPANFLIVSTVSTAFRSWYYRYTMNLTLLRKRISSGTPHPTTSDITTSYNSATGSYGGYVLGTKGLGNSSIQAYSLFKYKEEFKRDGVNANYGIPYVMNTPIVAEEALFNLAEGYIMKEDYSKVIELLNMYYAARVISYNSTSHAVTDALIMAKYRDGGSASAPAIAPHYASKLNSKQNTYLKCIINIRASEFLKDGQRWFDIKRMHISVEHPIYGSVLDESKDVLTPTDSRRIIPLPEDVIANGLGAFPATDTKSFEGAKSISLLEAYELLNDKINMSK